MLTLLRSYLFTAFLVFSVIAMGILCLPVIVFGKSAARRIARFWARMTLGALNLIAGVSYQVEGRPFLPQGGAVVAANHQSMWETIALYALLPKPVMVLKKELLRIPIYGWWAVATGCIAIDRKGGASALRAMRKAARNAIEEGEQVVVFPEGTRVAPGVLAPFQPGVAGIYAAADAPCVPVAHDSGRRWLHPGIRKSPGVIQLSFLTPLEAGIDRKTFMRTLQSRIEMARPDLQDAGKETENANV